jgi:hypothetical protein
MENIVNLREKNKGEKPRPAKKSGQDPKARSRKPFSNSVEWSAPEFKQHSKNKSWFMVIGLIAAGLFFWALLTKNILFALLIGLSYFSITAFALKKPRDIRLSITPRGIKIDKTLYSFDNLKSFWIFYEPPEVKELSLRSKKVIMPYIKIPLSEQNPVKVRKILIKYLPERKHKESLIDNLARSLRF